MLRIPTHPGAIIKDEIEALGISGNALAKDLGVDAPRVHDIIKCRRAVTPETAIRLAAYFGGSPLVWLRMQAVYDLARVDTEKGAAIRRSVRVAEKSMRQAE
jgi:addiction module HigA family antidote